MVYNTLAHLPGTGLGGRLLSGGGLGVGGGSRGRCCRAALVSLHPPDIVDGLPELLVGVHVHLGLALRAPDIPRGLAVLLGGGDVYGHAVEVWNRSLDMLFASFNS